MNYLLGFAELKRQIIFILFLGFSAINAQVNNGLIAKYSFDNGNANDDLGKHNAIAYSVDLSEDRFGNVGKAYYFHGDADSYINLGINKDLKQKIGSISLWFNWYATYSGGYEVETAPIITTRSHSNGDCDQAFYIGIDLNTKKLNGSSARSCTEIITSYANEKIILAKWYHVVLTFDHEYLQLYQNGKLKFKLKKKFENQYLEGDSIILGCELYKKNQRYFLGAIDDVELYDRVLLDKEILDLYNAPNPNKTSLLVTWFLYGALSFICAVAIVFLIRWRINVAVKKEKDKNQLRNDWFEQENKVLTAQMDPHFIFNSLNSIQQFIIVNENEKAQLYLTKFSRLLRMILESNTKDSIELKEEIKILNHYLEIESLRFNNVFDYTITVPDYLKEKAVYIPRFLIQPFVENALWHGLLPKDGDKKLSISFEFANEKKLLCIIEDNGVGLKHQQESPTKKSLAINFVRMRLKLMSDLYKNKYELKLIEKKDEYNLSDGLKVILSLPILEEKHYA